MYADDDFVGLQAAYLTWGVIQEQTMKRPYPVALPATGPTTRPLLPSSALGTSLAKSDERLKGE